MSNMIFVTPGVQASQRVIQEYTDYNNLVIESEKIMNSFREYVIIKKQQQIEKEQARQAILKRNYKAKLKRWREEDRKNDI